MIEPERVQLETLRHKWRLLRFRAGFESTRQADEALQAGRNKPITYGLVARLESPAYKVDPRASTLIRLADIYGVPPAEMLSTELPPEPYKHLGEGWENWIPDEENLNVIAVAWILAVMNSPPTKKDLEEISLQSMPEGMALWAWVADPANLRWIKAAKAASEFEGRKPHGQG